MRRLYIPIAVLAVVILASAFWLYFREEVPEGVIDASGQVRGTEVTVSSKLSGRVVSLPVREGERVGEGDLVARLSSEEIAARVERARAQVEAARGRLGEGEARIRRLSTKIEEAEIAVKSIRDEVFHSIHEARAALEGAEAKIEKARSEFELAKSDYERFTKLLAKGVVTRRRFEEAEAGFRSTRSELEAAEQAREQARAALEKAEASESLVALREKERQGLMDEKASLAAAYRTAESELESARARLREAEAVLRDTFILSPISGTVINKLMEEGELVSSGTAIAVIVDLSELYVRVFIPERDVGKIRLGNPVRIYADAFPDRFFEGTVIEVSQEAEFTPKEVHMKEERTKLVFGVKVRVLKPEGFLKTGMPVDVRIRWKEDARW